MRSVNRQIPEDDLDKIYMILELIRLNDIRWAYKTHNEAKINVKYTCNEFELVFTPIIASQRDADIELLQMRSLNMNEIKQHACLW